MASPENLVPSNPLELSLPFAHELTFNKKFDIFGHSDYETNTIRELNLSMMRLNMIGDYDVTTNLAFIVPEDTTPDEEGNVEIMRMELETGFVGDLMGGRTLKIAQLAGNKAVKAVCLTFQDVLIKYRRSVENAVVPRFESIPKEDRMYVPVFAVSEISQAA